MITRQATAQAPAEVQEELASFLSRLEAGGASSTHVRAHQQALGRFAEFLAPRSLREAREADAETFAAYLAELGVSPASLTVYRTVLHRWFEAMPRSAAAATPQPGTTSAPAPAASLVDVELTALSAATRTDPPAPSTPAAWQSVETAAPQAEPELVATAAVSLAPEPSAPVAPASWSAVSADSEPASWFEEESPRSDAAVTRVDPAPIAAGRSLTGPSLGGWSLEPSADLPEPLEPAEDFATVMTPALAPPPMPALPVDDVNDDRQDTRTLARQPDVPPAAPFVRRMDDTRGRAALSELAAPYNGGAAPADGLALAPADDEMTWLENAAAQATAGRGQHDHLSQSASLSPAPESREAPHRREAERSTGDSWAIRRGGAVTDDLSLTAVRGMVRRGEVVGTDFVRKGDASWTRVADYAPLRSSLAPARGDRAPAEAREGMAWTALSACIAAIGGGALAWTALIVAQRDFPLAWTLSGAACGLLVRIMARPSRSAGAMAAASAFVAAALSTYMLFMAGSSGVAAEGFGAATSLAAFVMARVTAQAAAHVAGGAALAFAFAVIPARRPAR